MLGFLATIITVLFSLFHSRSFAKYEKDGYLDVFLSIYISSILSLIVTFILSILSFSSNYSPYMHNLTLMSAINNIFQIGIITIIIVNLFKRAAKDAANS